MHAMRGVRVALIVMIAMISNFMAGMGLFKGSSKGLSTKCNMVVPFNLLAGLSSSFALLVSFPESCAQFFFFGLMTFCLLFRNKNICAYSFIQFFIE